MSTEHTLADKSCVYCGNNPVNHAANYLHEFISTLTAPFYQVMMLIPLDITNKIVSIMYWPIIYLAGKCGIWKYHRSNQKIRTDRSRVIWEEAKKRGIEMEGLLLFGKPIEQYRAKVNGRWYYFESLPIPPHLHHNRYAWLDDKYKFKKLMSQFSIPTPYGGKVTTYQQALSIYRTGHAPFIVKPRSGSRGRHTTTFIYTETDLKRAFDIGKQLSYSLIIEEHLIGSVYRGTYIGGEVVGILQGDPPRVVGDGSSTIRELIQEKNTNKHERVKEFIPTEHAVSFLRRQGFSLDTVLSIGNMVDLSEKIGLSYGGSAIERIDQTHPEILRILKVAGDRTGSPIVGFDFIIPDVSVDPQNQRWGLIEANSLPFIDLHHFPLKGIPVNVAAKVWDLWK